MSKRAFSYCKLRRLWLSKQTIMIVNVEPLKRPAVGLTWIMVFNLSNLSRSGGWLGWGWGVPWYPAGTWRELPPPQCCANALNYRLAVLLLFFYAATLSFVVCLLLTCVHRRRTPWDYCGKLGTEWSLARARNSWLFHFFFKGSINFFQVL